MLGVLIYAGPNLNEGLVQLPLLILINKQGSHGRYVPVLGK